jgi:hypothetical protein
MFKKILQVANEICFLDDLQVYSSFYTLHNISMKDNLSYLHFLIQLKDEILMIKKTIFGDLLCFLNILAATITTLFDLVYLCLIYLKLQHYTPIVVNSVIKSIFLFKYNN